MLITSSSILSSVLFGVVYSLEHTEHSISSSHIHPIYQSCPRRNILSNSCYPEHDHETGSNASLPLDIEVQPWTIDPICTNISNKAEQFCAFTSTTLYNNRGITLVTKPKIANIIGRQPAFSNISNHTISTLSEHDTRDPPYEVRDLPGRGKGVIATRRIERGELIFAHAAIAMFHNDAVDKEFPNYLAHHSPVMRQSINQLPLPTKEKFLAMAAHFPGEPYIERIYTNTFGAEFGEEEHSILVPETARLNHDCRPNAMYYFDLRTFLHYTHAARPIIAGEEITITYVDPVQTRLKRRKAIKHSWGFDCTCSLCSQSQAFARESNRRIRLIMELNEVFEETDRRERRVAGSAEMAELLVSLYEMERLDATVSEGYRYAALSYSALGKKWEALKWASKAVETGLVNDWPRETSIRDMMKLLDDVEEHWSWGVNLEETLDDETSSKRV